MSKKKKTTLIEDKLYEDKEHKLFSMYSTDYPREKEMEVHQPKSIKFVEKKFKIQKQ